MIIKQKFLRRWQGKLSNLNYMLINNVWYWKIKNYDNQKTKIVHTLFDALIKSCSSFCDVINGTRQIGSGSFFNNARSHDSANSTIQ